MTELSTLSGLQEEILELQRQVDELEEAKKKISEGLAGKKAELLSFMIEAKLDNFKTKSGTITVNRKFQVTCPKGDDLDSFFAFLGANDPMAASALRTVNYSTLNSWYSEKLAEAGESAPFLKIPGIKAATCNEFLTVRRIKG